MSKKTTTILGEKKKSGEKITMLTAYDYATAKLMDEAGIDCLLIGDSLGMVFKGDEDTLSVTVDEIIYHTKVVKKGVKDAFIISDMPFLSYHISREDAIFNAGRMIKEAGADAVKLEGGTHILKTVKAIVRAQIPVVAHIGLTPQSVKAFGGFKVQGKTDEAFEKLLKDAKDLEKAGAFMIVLEAIPKKLGKKIAEELSIPTIGIGAGNFCDGQVLVYQDMLGLFSDFTPKFVKRYANLGGEMKKAFANYIKEVSDSTFPDDEHSF
ncbi:MAG: 3-methyl-2-oxobutanoate hydroxymethyltransferase [Clostridiales Family XIII bacterium]|jgi:3-methyl-2-oxobutanoate hydroxymethyltransferase|nr:3-methyl-2-oxobutanoate hydroxymethyltransferase [Clostridiales Family XIII bacterium]